MNKLREKLQQSGKWINPYILKSDLLTDRILVNDSTDQTSQYQPRITELLATPTKSILVELGSGSGQHLLALAKRHPESLVFGFELRFKRAVRTIEKSIKAELENVFMLRTNSNNIENLFSNNSIDAIYINFPDPWQRKRWHKHRMINAQSLTSFATKLKPQGTLNFKTDHEGYFNDSLELIKASKQFHLGFATNDLHNSEHVTGNILTEFEQLFISQGLPIYALRATRIETHETL